MKLTTGTGVLLNNCQTFLICISSKKHYENEQSSTRKFIHTFSKIFKITNYLGHTYLTYIHKTIMLRPFSFTTDYPRSGQQAAFNIYSQILKKGCAVIVGYVPEDLSEDGD